MTKFVRLKNRSFILIQGQEQVDFLQGLISNDLKKIDSERCIYALMLNAQGRFLYEFFISKYQNGLLLESCTQTKDSLIKKLSLYKLRSRVEISRIDDLEAVFIDDINYQNKEIIKYQDPRLKNFGLRCYVTKEQLAEISNNINEKNLDYYHNLRLHNKIIDENDLTFDKSLIAEYGFDNFNAIDYNKGCYIGQEVIARSHYKGIIRKKIFLVEIDNMKEVAKNSEITCDGKKQGIILSSLLDNGKMQALALIKNIDSSGAEIKIEDIDLKIDNAKISILK